MSGWLSDVFGRKRYYMASVALFTFASLCCGLAPSLTILIVARIVQGIGGGGLQPVTQAMLIDTFPPAARGKAMAVYGFTVILAPMLGPLLGGWITDQFSWHWIFLINVPVGMLSLFLVEHDGGRAAAHRGGAAAALGARRALRLPRRRAHRAGARARSR